MFTGRIDDENKSDILDMLNRINENGITNILASCESLDLLQSTTEVYEIDREADLDILC